MVLTEEGRMSEQRWALPFAPPQQQAQAEEPIWDLLCDQCGEEIKEDEEDIVELYRGKAGRGPKSGRAMVTQDPLIDFPSVTLHIWCVSDFAQNELYSDGEGDNEVYCAGCEAKLSGDGD